MWQPLSPKKYRQEVIHDNGMQQICRAAFIFIVFKPVRLMRLKNLFYSDSNCNLTSGSIWPNEPREKHAGQTWEQSKLRVEVSVLNNKLFSMNLWRRAPWRGKWYLRHYFVLCIMKIGHAAVPLHGIHDSIEDRIGT